MRHFLSNSFHNSVSRSLWKQLFKKVKYHMGGGGGQKSANKVSRIIWMTPKTLNQCIVVKIFSTSCFSWLKGSYPFFAQKINKPHFQCWILLRREDWNSLLTNKANKYLNTWRINAIYVRKRHSNLNVKIQFNFSTEKRCVKKINSIKIFLN